MNLDDLPTDVQDIIFDYVSQLEAHDRFMVFFHRVFSSLIYIL